MAPRRPLEFYTQHKDHQSQIETETQPISPLVETRGPKNTKAQISFLNLRDKKTELSPGSTVRIDSTVDGRRLYSVYRKESEADRHLHLACLETGPDPVDGSIRRCNWHQRVNRISLDPVYGTHRCKFTLAASTLDNVVISDTESKFTDHLAYLGGKLNISLSNATSDYMQQFVGHVFKLGQQNPKAKLEKVIKWPTRYDVRKSMINVALKETEEVIRDYRHSRYVSLAIDEGSTLGTKYVHLLLHDVHRNMGEYCVSTQILSGTGTAEDYVEALQSGFVEVTSHEVCLGSVVVDGGTAQLKALSDKPNMLRSKLPVKGPLGEMRKYIIFPCICHKLNNCYKSICRSCHVFDAFISSIRTVADQCKTALHCPQFVSTRWLNDASILKFLDEHREDVSTIISGQSLQELYRNINIWKPLVYMLRSMVDQLEASNAPAADIWPKIYTLSSDLRKCGSENEKKIQAVYRQMAQTLEKEILLNGQYLVAFMLTPIGRDWFRYPEPWRAKPIINTYSFREKSHDKEDDLTGVENTMEKIIDPERVRSVLLSEPCDSDKGEPERGQLIRAVLDDPSSDASEEAVDDNESEQDGNADGTAKVTDHSLENDTTEETTDGTRPQLKPGQWKTVAFSAWESMSQTIFGSASKKSINHAYSQLNTYLSTSNSTSYEESLCQIEGLNLWNWENLIDNKEFAEIAEIALRIRPTPASEASAERYISLQRLVILARRNRANKDLTDARMALLKRPTKNRDVYVHVNVAENRKRIRDGVYRVER